MTAVRPPATYWSRCELLDGRSFLISWNLDQESREGSGRVWKDEQALFESILSMFTDGNYSCDCNKDLYCHYALGGSYDDFDFPRCGDTLRMAKLTVIRPDGSEEVLQCLH